MAPIHVVMSDGLIARSSRCPNAGRMRDRSRDSYDASVFGLSVWRAPSNHDADSSSNAMLARLGSIHVPRRLSDFSPSAASTASDWTD